MATQPAPIAPPVVAQELFRPWPPALPHRPRRPTTLRRRAAGCNGSAAPTPWLQSPGTRPSKLRATASAIPVAPAQLLQFRASAKASPFGEDAGVDLAEMFGELKQDLEADVASADEDPETHYNLGIAFREMGLLDEAIGELQKACQSFDHGHPFPQIMQTYTWLAQCFLEKGVPEAAVRWYDKALNVPDHRRRNPRRAALRTGCRLRDRRRQSPPLSSISWMSTATTSTIATWPSALRP